MHTRTLVLREAGFLVDQAFDLKRALALVVSDTIDAMILCHTVSKQEQAQLIAAAHKLRRLLPIICIEASEFVVSPEDCVNTHNDPNELLNAVKSAVQISPQNVKKSVS